MTSFHIYVSLVTTFYVLTVWLLTQFFEHCKMADDDFCNTPFPSTSPADYLESTTPQGDMSKATKVTADIDSIFLISSNFENLIDAACPNGTTWSFPNIIQRTRSDSGSRAKLHFAPDFMKPKFAGRQSENNFPAEWFPNIELCSLSMDSGLLLHMNYYILGSEECRKVNYLTSKELAVLCSAFNYAKDQ